VGKACEQSGFLAQVPRLLPPSQVSSVDCGRNSPLQWRDRAGFTPASLFWFFC